MLVLSRRQEESIVFPALGIRIQVLRSSRANTTLGIDAPREISVIRGELFDETVGQLDSRGSKAADKFAVSKKTQATASVMKKIIHEAADTLNQLHLSAELSSKELGDKAIFGLFGQLKRLDAEVASLTGSPQEVKEKRALKALLVDDNANEARLLSSYLQVKGFDVQTAFDGQDAMNQMSESEPDVVLLDMSMPKFDGRWTIDQIRGDHSLDSLTVFAVSGTNQIDSDVEVGPRGVNQWFRKPLNPEDLISEIAKCMPATEASLN